MAKPNIKEIMDATGVSSKEASDLLYGVVGSNVDTRNWDAIMASSDPASAARAATQQMVDSREDNSTIDPAKDYHGSAVQKAAPSDKSRVEVKDDRAYVYGANGTLLRVDTLSSLQNNPNSVQQMLNVGASLGELQSAAGGSLAQGDFKENPTSTQDLLLPASERMNMIAEAKAEADRQRPLRNYEAARQDAEGAARRMQGTFTRDATPEARQATLQRIAAAEERFNPYGFQLNKETGKLSETRFKELYADLLPLSQPLPSFGRSDTTAKLYVDGLGQDYFNSVFEQTKAERQEEGTGVGVVAPTISAPQATPTAPTYTPTTPGTTQTPTTDTGTPAAVAPTTPTPGSPYPQQPVTGTFPSPTQTGGLGAVPGSVPAMAPGVAGYDVNTLAGTMPGVAGAGVGVQTVNYSNQLGQTIPVTESNGQPVTYVPPGYTRVAGAAEGGMMRKGYAEGGVASEDTMLEAKYRIATMNGYNGPKTNASLNAFANASEGMKRKFNAIGTVMANKGGYIKRGFDEGGLSTPEDLAKAQANLVGQTMQPMQAPVAQIEPQALDFIPTTAGQTSTVAPMAQAATVGNVEQAQMPVMAPTATMQPATVTPQVQQETAQLQAAQGTVTPQAQVQAAQQEQTSVAGLEAAQGTAIMMDNPVQREIQQGELISGVADAEKAAQFNEQIQAATATPTAQATVQGQLEGLMQQFEGGETPAWAAGSMRAAMATLSARGLGASSMAGQAVIQATMEAALPIAQIDAQTQAQFEAQNLSNRQQRAMLAAQQRAQFLGQEFDQDFQARVQNSARIGDIANMNFTAEQQVALENSRAANTMELNNLSNSQAMVMAEAAALSNLDMANLNNRQQAAVQNAQNFLQMDMANLSNEQQTAMFKSQQNLQALFTDQAAENAAAQFNASSENQTNQFFASLTSQTSQFNAAQRNAMDQFNVNSVNALREFNTEIQQQRDMFNAQNGLVIAQSNAQWRQNIATINTAQQNQSNMDFAKTMNALTASNMDQLWQRERDLMSFAFAASESSADRAANIALAKLTAEEQGKLQDNIGKGKLVALGVEGLIKKWLQ